jgi:hypothetical protein
MNNMIPEPYSIIDIVLSVSGSALAILGSLIACIGVYVNNQKHDHIQAMRLWSWSNPMLCVWAVGWCAGLWDGAVPVAGLAIMYAYYSISNRMGLQAYERGE